MLIAIVHFQPLDKYPPVQNLIRHFCSVHTDVEVVVITSDAGAFSKRVTFRNLEYCTISGDKYLGSKWTRAFYYLVFSLRAFFKLRKIKAGSVLYYETVSAGGPLMYKFIYGQRSRLFIHYHEYTSRQEYVSGMIWTRILHWAERGFYHKTEWISHTNIDRLELFRSDCAGISFKRLQAIPNYPLSDWAKNISTKMSNAKGVTSFVYAGALSLETMFVAEFLAWMNMNRGLVTLDVYSNNYSEEVLVYLKKQGGDLVRFHTSIDYAELPGVLAGYDIGLILYKGLNANFTYNIPNKLFEYHACGLDVWFPSIMSTCYQVQKSDTRPRILSVDFNNPESLDTALRRTHEDGGVDKWTFNFEDVIYPLFETILDSK